MSTMNREPLQSSIIRLVSAGVITFAVVLALGIVALAWIGVIA
ncbi:hypothetical protein [Nocardia wallacei]|nr:hypothetical protein [Nocardia wallacei]